MYQVKIGDIVSVQWLSGSFGRRAYHATLTHVLHTAVHKRLHSRPDSIQVCNKPRVKHSGYVLWTIQVGRLQPLEDAAAVLHIREAVGRSVELRADANQKWCSERGSPIRTCRQGCRPAGNPHLPRDSAALAFLSILSIYLGRQSCRACSLHQSL